jgi:hypothetical protein
MAVSNVFNSQQDLKVAQHDADVAQAEYKQSQQGVNNILATAK